MAGQESLTFGVELEFAVFYQLERTPPNQRLTNLAGKGPLLIVPVGRDANGGEFSTDSEGYLRPAGEKWITGKIAETIRALGVSVRVATDNVVLPRHMIWGEWVVSTDETIIIPEPAKHFYGDLPWMGIEVQSPTLTYSEESFRQVTAVVNAIRTAHSTATPPSCGLHVHVGNGGNPILMKTFQRTAALVWAAEHILGQAHPSCRRENVHCLGPRTWSYLAVGEKAARYVESSMQVLRKPHPAVPTRIPADLPRLWPDAFERKIRTGRAETLERRRETFQVADKFQFAEYRPHPDTDDEVTMLGGVEELLKCLLPRTVAGLMQPRTSWRGAYNFGNLLHEQTFRSSEIKRTIEFRQAAGSLNGQWVAIWARICAGLARWATYADDDDFVNVLCWCDAGERNSKVFDVFDLLVATGLADEASFLQERLLRGDHVEEVIGDFS